MRNRWLTLNKIFNIFFCVSTHFHRKLLIKLNYCNFCFFLIQTSKFSYLGKISHNMSFNILYFRKFWNVNFIFHAAIVNLYLILHNFQQFFFFCGKYRKVSIQASSKHRLSWKKNSHLKYIFFKGKKQRWAAKLLWIFREKGFSHFFPKILFNF